MRKSKVSRVATYLFSKFTILFSALGIICNLCTPDQASLIACNQPDQLTEVNCDNQIPFNVSEGTRYDACAKTVIVAELSGIKIQTFIMSCAVKVGPL